MLTKVIMEELVIIPMITVITLSCRRNSMEKEKRKQARKLDLIMTRVR